MAAVFHTHAKGETLSRYIEIMLEKRNVRCVARMLDEEAPKTCEAVWSALPQSGDVYHAKYASNEIYTLVAPFAEEETGPENRTIAPAKGDVMYFHLPPGFRLPPEARELEAARRGVVDLAVFYDRNNLLLSPSEGLTPGNVFATIVKNMAEMTAAGHSVWREGFVGERLIYSRLEDERLKDWGIDED